MPADTLKPLVAIGPISLFAFALASCSVLEGPSGGLTPTSGRSVGAADDADGGRGAEDGGLALRPLDRAELGGDLGIGDPFPDYNRGGVTKEARLFLVAGGASDASYLQEIVVLRDYWMKQGYSASEIACYYVKPEKASYEADRQRFDSMATRVESFYLAAPHVLFRHLKEVAASGPGAVHLYVNGQGKLPLDGTSEERSLTAKYPDFGGSHRIVLRGGPSGHMNERMRLEALRDGIDAHYLVFNAQFLAEALNELPPSCEKFVVLNADYSGGFLTTRSGDDGLLRGLDKITVLASAAHDRQNMTQGGELSQFGGFFLTALSSGSGRVENRSWREIANEVIVGVDRSEGGTGVRLKLRSRPVFFSSLPRESGPAVVLASESAEPEEPAADRVAPPMRPVSGLPAPKSPRTEVRPVAPEAKPVGEMAPEKRTVPEPSGSTASAFPFSWFKPAEPAQPTVKVESRKGGVVRAVVPPRGVAGLGLGRGGFGR